MHALALRAASGWHRPGSLPEELIHGTPTNEPQHELQAAHAWLALNHLAPCRPDAPLLFKRWPTFGVSNDLNIVVRSFAFAVGAERQLVLLPPRTVDRAKVRALAGELGVHRPWHWLEAGVPTASQLCTVQVAPGV